jgi:hypothetical protein
MLSRTNRRLASPNAVLVACVPVLPLPVLAPVSLLVAVPTIAFLALTSHRDFCHLLGERHPRAEGYQVLPKFERLIRAGWRRRLDEIQLAVLCEHTVADARGAALQEFKIALCVLEDVIEHFAGRIDLRLHPVLGGNLLGDVAILDVFPVLRDRPPVHPVRLVIAANDHAGVVLLEDRLYRRDLALEQRGKLIAFVRQADLDGLAYGVGLLFEFLYTEFGNQDFDHIRDVQAGIQRKQFDELQLILAEFCPIDEDFGRVARCDVCHRFIPLLWTARHFDRPGRRRRKRGRRRRRPIQRPGR